MSVRFLPSFPMLLIDHHKSGTLLGFLRSPGVIELCLSKVESRIESVLRVLDIQNIFVSIEQVKCVKKIL